MSVGAGRVIHMTTAVDTEPTTAQLLDFEARWPRHTGRKETAIIETLGIAPARFYVLLLRVLRRASANNRVALRI